MGSLRGIRLLSAIFGELSHALNGEEISREELLEAAQKLIELSKSEYIRKEKNDVARHSGYFSYELTVAFSKYQARILLNEHRMWQDDDLDEVGRHTLQNLITGSSFEYELGMTHE